MRSRLSVFATVLAAGVLGLSACGGSGDSGRGSGSGPTEVVVASSFTLPGTPIQIADDRGYFADEGIEIRYERIKATSDAIPMLARGDVSAATGSPSAGLYNALAGGSDLRIVADAGTASEGHPLWYLTVRKDLVDSGEVEDFADLKGLKIALPGPGTGFDRGLATALDEGGLSADDIEVVSPVSFPDMLVGLRNESIDAAFMIQPLVAAGVADGTLVPLWNTVDIVGPKQEGFLMYSPQFARDTETATAFMRAYLRGVRDYIGTFSDAPTLSAADAQAVIAHVAEVTGVPEEALKHLTDAPGVSPDGTVDAQDLIDLQQFFVDNGSVDEPADLEKFIDTSFVEAAVAEEGTEE